MGYKQRLEKLEVRSGGIIEPYARIAHNTDADKWSITLCTGMRNIIHERYNRYDVKMWDAVSEADARAIIAEKVSGYNKPMMMIFTTENEEITERWIVWVNAGKPGGLLAEPHGELRAEYLMPDGTWCKEGKGR